MKAENLEVSITIEVRQANFGNGAIQIRENFFVKPRSFLEMCQMLGKFQELAERIKKEEQ